MANKRYLQMVSYPSQVIACPGGGIGRHKGFKIPRRSRCAGSSPARGTIYKESSSLDELFFVCNVNTSNKKEPKGSFLLFIAISAEANNATFSKFGCFVRCPITFWFFF